MRLVRVPNDDFVWKIRMILNFKNYINKSPIPIYTIENYKFATSIYIQLYFRNQKSYKPIKYSRRYAFMEISIAMWSRLLLCACARIIVKFQVIEVAHYHLQLSIYWVIKVAVGEYIITQCMFWWCFCGSYFVCIVSFSTSASSTKHELGYIHMFYIQNMPWDHRQTHTYFLGVYFARRVAVVCIDSWGVGVCLVAVVLWGEGVNLCSG